MRAASITIASVSARQTSEVERSSRPAAGKDTARTCGGLRIRNTQRFGRFKEERPRRAGAFLQATLAARAYLSEPLIEANLPFRLVPRPLTTAMIASAMPAAIRPYSIAV